MVLKVHFLQKALGIHMRKQSLAFGGLLHPTTDPGAGKCAPSNQQRR